MRRLLPAVVSAVVITSGLGACGSDKEQFDAQPKTTPDLIAPEDVTLAQPSATTPDAASTTPTTGTAATPATPPASGGAAAGGAQAPATPATPAPSGGAPAPATPAPATGTKGAGTGGAQDTQGGGNANPGGFSDFCAQNPGACGTGN
jgi:hypothetical protein